MKPRYYVTTWDTDKQQFTPQKGVRKGPYSLFGLRKALRALRGMGYSADRSDHAVLVERDYIGADWNSLIEEANRVTAEWAKEQAP